MMTLKLLYMCVRNKKILHIHKYFIMFFVTHTQIFYYLNTIKLWWIIARNIDR